MNKARSRFLMRWLVGTFGLWVASIFLGSESLSYEGKISVIIIAGFLLALVNTFIRPLVVFLTLPAVLLSLGLFMIVINALMVLLVSRLYGDFEISGFGVAVIIGLVIGLVNWLVSVLLEEEK